MRPAPDAPFLAAFRTGAAFFAARALLPPFDRVVAAGFRTAAFRSPPALAFFTDALFAGALFAGARFAAGAAPAFFAGAVLGALFAAGAGDFAALSFG